MCWERGKPWPNYLANAPFDLSNDTYRTELLIYGASSRLSGRRGDRRRRKCPPRSPLSLSPHRSQGALVEGDRFLHVLIPIVPRVRAREFLVLVRDAQLFQVAMEGAVLCQKAIFAAAIDPERWQQLAVELFGQRVRIVRASSRRGTEDTPHLRRHLRVLYPPPDIEG